MQNYHQTNNAYYCLVTSESQCCAMSVVGAVATNSEAARHRLYGALMNVLCSYSCCHWTTFHHYFPGLFNVGFIELSSNRIGLIQVKEEGKTGFSEGRQGCFKGFPEGRAQGKSRGSALPVQGSMSRTGQLLLSSFVSV